MSTISEWDHLLQQNIRIEQQFEQQLKNGLASIQKHMEEEWQNFDNSMKTINDELINIANQNDNKLLNIEEKKFRLNTMRIWNQAFRDTIQMEQDNLKVLEGLNEKLRNSYAKEQLKEKELRSKINENQIRKNQVDHILRTKKDIRSAQKSKEIVQKIIYSPFYTENSNKVIFFDPYKKELIFKVETFEGKILDFILFFEANEGKFGLKNPNKTFQTRDTQAVKSFNVHQNKMILLQQFKDLVSRYIDNISYE